MGVIAGALVAMAIPLVISAINVGWQEAVTSYNGKINQQATDLAKQIYTKIANNEKKSEQLINAYNNRDQELLSAILNGMGFGIRHTALTKARTDLKNQFKEDKAKLDQERTELNNAYNELNNATLNTGTIAGARANEQTVNKYTPQKVDGVEQAIQGGIQRDEKFWK